MFWDPDLTPSSFHGVTTVVAGNCGFSIAPIRPDGVGILARTLQHVEDMSFDTLSVGVPWDEFETFPQYLDAVGRRGTALNYGCYVGHTATRLYVMGDEAYERAATPDELDRMQAVVAEAMAGGAIGFASSASPTHNGDQGRPVPSRVADLDELRHLLAPLRDADRGVVALLPGGVFSNEQVFDLQREVGRPFTWTALLTIKGFPYHEGVIEEHDDARADGRRRVAAGVVPAARVPDEPGRAVHAQHARLVQGAHEQDPRRAQGGLRRPVVAGDGVGRTSPGKVDWSSLSVAESERPPRPGRPAGASTWPPSSGDGTTALDVMLDLSLEDDLRTRFWSVLANNDPDGIAWLLPRDGVLLGLADSGAHVSQLCDACFATDLLGSWVRDREVMPLERAIHKLTGEPAAVYGLADRGARRRRARRPTSSCSTPTRSRPARCAASTTSRPTASASPPTPRRACATRSSTAS